MMMVYWQLGMPGLRIQVLSFYAGTLGGSGPLFGIWGSSDISKARRLADVQSDAGFVSPDLSVCLMGGRS